MAIRTTDVDRFWGCVEKTGSCWLWTRERRPNGYGVFWSANVRHSAHRVAYELSHGPIPNGMGVLHSCDNRACVRPEHLSAGTQLENIQDRDSKGRNLLGSKSPRARLTEAQVSEIMTAPRYRGWQRDLARKFSVARSTVTAAARGQNWKHIERRAS